MISYDQYLLLKQFYNNVFDTKNNYDENIMKSLQSSKLVKISKYTNYPNYFVPNEYSLTELGKSAIEEYEHFITKEKRSNSSNRIAWISLFVSAIAVIISLFK